MTPPEAGDILRVAAHYGWPLVRVGRTSVGPGEASWRRTVPSLDGSALLAIWTTSWQNIGRPLERRSAVQARPDYSADLYACPPSNREFAVACSAITAAQRYGLRVHPCDVRWFDGDPRTTVDGYADPHDATAIHVRRGMPDGQLFATIVHELWHLHDVRALGLSRFLQLPPGESERRARAFEFRVTLAEGLGVVL